MGKIYILCEGKTEKQFLDQLKTSNKDLKLFQTNVFNIFQDKMSTIIRRLEFNSTVIIIFDIDVLDNQTNFNLLIKKFTENITMLIQNGCKVKLLQQTKDFEDELCKACQNCKQINLNKAFGAQSVTEFKNRFLKTTNILSILERLSFNLNEMWQGEPHKELKRLNLKAQFANALILLRVKK